MHYTRYLDLVTACKYCFLMHICCISSSSWNFNKSWFMFTRWHLCSRSFFFWLQHCLSLLLYLLPFFLFCFISYNHFCINGFFFKSLCISVTCYLKNAFSFQTLWQSFCLKTFAFYWFWKRAYQHVVVSASANVMSI